MKILYRYMLQQNVLIILACLAVGLGVYILADLFDRLDDFLEAGLGAGIIITYFVVKTPLIISQIMPAVFLIASVLQLSIMNRSRELLALQASGISITQMILFFLFYSLAWSIIQLGFSQMVGVYGEQEAGRIWKEEVRKTQMDKRVLYNVWFKEKRFVVKLDEAIPSQERGKGITVHKLAKNELAWEQILRAKTYQGSVDGWTLFDVEEMSPEGFLYKKYKELDVDLHRDLKAYIAIDPHRDPSQLPLWRLGQVVAELEASGSNVEGLRTVWHLKLSYAFSLVVMGFIALSLATVFQNVYANIATALLLTFAYYGLTIVFVSAGEKGFVPPFIAAWSGNMLFCGVALLRLIWYARPKPVQKIEAGVSKWSKMIPVLGK